MFSTPENPLNVSNEWIITSVPAQLPTDGPLAAVTEE